MYEFRPAVRSKTSVLIALAGASGSGKTMTAILMAMGLAYPGQSSAEILETLRAEGKSRVCFIDTEGGRGLHYAPGAGEDPDFSSSFPFAYAEIIAPYTPEAYQEAITSADAQGFHVIIVDSTSHEWESEGGVMEIADQIETGKLKPGKTLADTEGRDGWKAWEIKPVKSPGNWKEPKTRHKKMVNRAIQSRAHIIFCLRAEEKMLMERVPKLDDRGEQKVWNGQPQFETRITAPADRPLLERWVPICEKRFMYEMTVSFLLLPSAPGVGHPIKNLQAQFQPMFPEGQRLGVENGRKLSDWAHGRKAERSETGSSPMPATTSNGGGSRRTPEQLVAAYEARLSADPKDGGFADLDALQRFQADAATVKFTDSIREKHPELHLRIVRANTGAYERLQKVETLDEPEEGGGDGSDLFGGDK